MSYKIDDIEGIGPAYAEKLGAEGIKTTEDLLEHCCHKKGRAAMAEKTGISEKLVLNWANKADLMRVKGVSSQYSELLEAAGVDTVKELRNRNAENTAAKMKEVNDEKNLTNAVPSAGEVQKWIDQAKEMEPMITH